MSFRPANDRGEMIANVWQVVLAFWIIFLFVAGTAVAIGIPIPMLSLATAWLTSLVIGFILTGLVILITKE